jgi:hypothetical protein
MGWTARLCGRDKLVERIWAWMEQYEKRILGQLRDLGASCDWDRTRLTGSLTSCPRRLSTGIATTGCSPRITSSGPPSRHSPSGTSPSGAMPRLAGMRSADMLHAEIPTATAATHATNRAFTTPRGSPGPN